MTAEIAPNVATVEARYLHSLTQHESRTHRVGGWKEQEEQEERGAIERVTG